MPGNEFLQRPNGQLSFEMSDAPASVYYDLRDDIARTFKLTPAKPLVTNEFDVAFQEFRRGEQLVSIEWDNWSGFCVLAKTPASEVLVREIADWLLKRQ